MPFEKEEKAQAEQPQSEPQDQPVQDENSGDMFAFLDDPKFQEELASAKNDEDKFYMAALALSGIVGDESKMDDKILGELQAKMKEKGMLQNEPQEAQEPQDGQEAPVEGEDQEASPEGQEPAPSEDAPEDGQPEDEQPEDEQPIEDGNEAAPEEDMPVEDRPEIGNEQDPNQFHGTPEQDEMNNYVGQLEQSKEKVIQRALRVIEALLREE